MSNVSPDLDSERVSVGWLVGALFFGLPTYALIASTRLIWGVESGLALMFGFIAALFGALLGHLVGRSMAPGPTALFASPEVIGPPCSCCLGPLDAVVAVCPRCAARIHVACTDFHSGGCHTGGGGTPWR
jgi:hypothetical protein